MSCKHVISCTIVTLILLFIVIGIPIIIYEAVVKPKDPKFTLEHASITGFNLSSDGHLTSFFDVIIKANNPNHKLKLKYTSVRISIFKNKQKLGEDALDNFTQRKKNVTMLRSEAVALNVKLKESSRFDFRFESGNGYLDFDVFLTASLNGNSLEVNCKHAIVNVASPRITNNSNSGNNNGGNFRRVGCSVLIYNDDA
ncbi:NDR1/HIN1-like protein 13 [Chenopodium quinoa]|uniref:NDR1/HIN1-like protein 13 n=1 Tax=Chenopodium quinoa TaxID=63459 RepID=UPI000B76C122|nr:NDR1/HIN1-like protein 13 [Chenopodium quinoa]